MKRMFLVAVVLIAASEFLVAADYRVETTKAELPTEDLTANIVEQISTDGLRVVRGEKRTVCEIWPMKSWDVMPGFQSTNERLYPFRPGQLIGVLRFRRRGSDFRGQQISRGVYTMRFGTQPVDGNHEGTSPTRDFLLLVRAEDDSSIEPMGVKKLMEFSASAADSNHPAMLCLQRLGDKADVKDPRMRHDTDRDWWMLRFANDAKVGQKQLSLPIELVVEGHAEE
ncbi:MAG: hypothetical protein GY768_19610 [Planctomycetaceae bacterium]|nr:hypothetical protein [Planctomycetaceae bacterium]